MSVNTTENETPTTLRLISYNVQVGIHTRKHRDYILGGWKHLIPHTQRLTNLDQVAHFLSDYDIIGLQEVDAGSIRCNFINLIEYLAYRAELPFWYHQVNRNLGRLAQHSNGLLSQFKPDSIENIKLPGLIPGRQGILARFNTNGETLVVIVLHLALGKWARLKQLDYIADIVNQYPHAIVMGDLNCRAHSPEMQHLFRKTDLDEPIENLRTYPSWQPLYNIDHILVSSQLKVIKAEVVEHPVSDHLPIMMEIALPPGLVLNRDSQKTPVHLNEASV